MKHRKPTEIIAEDGQRIAVRFYAPTEAPRGAVLIAPAMGVNQDYYAEFAQWLTEQGYAVITFDYRGMGHSRHGGLRGFRADIFDWAKLDCSAAMIALENRFPDLPIYWVGHSLGGQILPLFPHHARLSKAITVATGSGYWRENVWKLRSYVWWLWYFVVPLTLPIFGYFPGRRLRKVGDLPHGVMAQWRRWCLHRDYAVGVEGETVRRQFATVKTPIVSISFTDDEFMSARNTESIHGFFTGAPMSMKRFSPQEIGVKHIGHFGFFRRRFANTLWHPHLLPELTTPTAP